MAQKNLSSLSRFLQVGNLGRCLRSYNKRFFISAPGNTTQDRLGEAVFHLDQRLRGVEKVALPLADTNFAGMQTDLKALCIGMETMKTMHTKTCEDLKAIRTETDTSLRALNKQLEVRFGVADRNLENMKQKMEAGFEAVDENFKAIDKRFEAVDKKFVALEDKIEEKDAKWMAYVFNADSREKNVLVIGLDQALYPLRDEHGQPIHPFPKNLRALGDMKKLELDALLTALHLATPNEMKRWPDLKKRQTLRQQFGVKLDVVDCR